MKTSIAVPELEPILQALDKPLRHASRDNFARLKRLKSLEPYLMRWLEKASALPLSPPWQGLLARFRALLKGLDEMETAARAERILALTGILGQLKGDISPAPAAPFTRDEFQRMRKELMTPMQFIRGVGPRLSQILGKKGLRTVEDALYFLPRGYQDRRRIKTISQLEVGRVETVVGTVLSAGQNFHLRRRTFEVHVGDETGVLLAKWFHYHPRYMKGRFRPGQRLILSGEVKLFQLRKEMHHPDLEVMEEETATAGSPTAEPPLHFQRIVPIYSETEGLYQRQRLLRRIMKNAVDLFAGKAESGIPEEICRRQGLIPLSEALRRAHFPAPEENLELLRQGKSPAHRRLIFDEFFFLELGLALRRSGTLQEKGIAFPISHGLTARLRGLLPFRLTPAQERVLREIESDMGRPQPMNRLLQGDVGSGKTVVALMAMLLAVEGGYQAALMVPTEILAEQHFRNFRPLIEGLGLSLSLLTRGGRRPDRKAALKEIEGGEIPLVIGTHALIQEEVQFGRLGLAVVDEQHKFGVVQRATLKKKGYHPDFLVMTATPIPRTLAMTVYGDLEVSTIDQLPPGRGPLHTRVFGDRERFRVYRLLREEIARGRQAYLVYPLVEESERLDLKDATRMAEHLQREVFPEFRVGLVHGRMKAEEKEDVMAEFKARRVHLLVSTIVIEVGIDVPNATVMVVEHAERFGLSQLHQLRGRVGRGPEPSHCLLVARHGTGEAGRRLRVMEETTDGFRIAEADLALRGPGEILGTQQSGLPDFRVANFIRDFPLLQAARKEAFALIAADPLLSRPEHLFLKEILKERWPERLELGRVG
ncbi:MAG: ATP-dependent DNA helicase RecG [Deltaproteobacteria bacterium]|nr:ATP-dependent DNA helicase RecG [Deltaproteobacteria bacterium]